MNDVCFVNSISYDESLIRKKILWALRYSRARNGIYETAFWFEVLDGTNFEKESIVKILTKMENEGKLLYCSDGKIRKT